jgi:hypothetical protein
MDYAVLILCLGAFLVACGLDFASSVEMTRYGIKESTSLVRDSSGNFSPLKALIFVIAPPVIVLLVFFLVSSDDVDGYDRLYAPLVLLPGAALHFWAFLKNKKAIKAKQDNPRVPGGAV